ncbi:MAG: PLDc N-terminal domain-containing protein [Micropruina sp.]|uniref:PLDc N-terminal domain-containing protein n=1 Tax=Micropruina sp. TaxID=2737536 RepID=UPI0039E5B183
MGRVLPVVLLALLVVYCLVEVAQADPDRVRVLPRWLWVALIILLPGVGAVAWLIAGRPRRQQPPPRRPRAPDDDPDFLRGL